MLEGRGRYHVGYGKKERRRISGRSNEFGPSQRPFQRLDGGRNRYLVVMALWRAVIPPSITLSLRWGRTSMWKYLFGQSGLEATNRLPPDRHRLTRPQR